MNIYKLMRPDGTVVTATARMLSRAVGYSADYIRELARTGVASADGCRVELLAELSQGELRDAGLNRPKVYLAENPDEDPIIGPAEEIAALTGYTERYVLNLASSGRVTKAGWRVRRATDAEVKEAGL